MDEGGMLDNRPRTAGTDVHTHRCHGTECPCYNEGQGSTATTIAALKAAILDIDAHATPLGEDADGFVSVGYAISVGSLHRALGLVGHSAAKDRGV